MINKSETIFTAWIILRQQFMSRLVSEYFLVKLNVFLSTGHSTRGMEQGDEVLVYGLVLDGILVHEQVRGVLGHNEVYLRI